MFLVTNERLLKWLVYGHTFSCKSWTYKKDVKGNTGISDLS